MKHNLIATAFLIVLLSLPANAAEGSAGSTGAAFLQLGVGARAGALAEAYTAWADDVYGAYFNPAGIATIRRQEIGFAHNTLFLDLDYNYMGYVLPLRNKGTIGLSAMYVDLGTVDNRQISAGGPTASLGSASGSDLAISLTYAQTMNDFLDLGGSLKLIHATLGDHSASAIAVDLGVKWRPPVPGLTVGLSLANLGTSLKFVRERDDLPLTLRAGVGYRSPSRYWGLTGDLVWVKNQEIDGKVGAEAWVWPEHLALRVGANSANDVGNSLTVGAGFRWKDLEMDYAYIPFGELGDQNLFSLAYYFGGERMTPNTPRVVRSRRAIPTPQDFGPSPVATREGKSDSGRRPKPAKTVSVRKTYADFVGERMGANASAFSYRSGSQDYSWMGSATADVLRHSWRNAGFLSQTAASALFFVDGEYWVTGERLYISAALHFDGKPVEVFQVSGDANMPFETWNRLKTSVNGKISQMGFVIQESAPQKSDARKAAPVAKREKDPYRMIWVGTVREYPALKETERSKQLALELPAQISQKGWDTGRGGAYKLEITVSFMDGGDVIVFGKVIDRNSGAILGNIEVFGNSSNLEAVAAKIADNVLKRLPTGK